MDVQRHVERGRCDDPATDDDPLDPTVDFFGRPADPAENDPTRTVTLSGGAAPGDRRPAGPDRPAQAGPWRPSTPSSTKLIDPRDGTPPAGAVVLPRATTHRRRRRPGDLGRLVQPPLRTARTHQTDPLLLARTRRPRRRDRHPRLQLAPRLQRRQSQPRRRPDVARPLAPRLPPTHAPLDPRRLLRRHPQRHPDDDRRTAPTNGDETGSRHGRRTPPHQTSDVTAAVARLGFDHGWLCLSPTFLNLQLPVLLVDQPAAPRPGPARVWSRSAAVTHACRYRPPGSSSNSIPAP